MWENVIQPDWTQIRMWYSQTGHRSECDTARLDIDQNVIQPDWTQIRMGCMCIACWITKAIDTHTQNMWNIPFPWQQWLGKCASMFLLYVHVSILLYCFIRTEIKMQHWVFIFLNRINLFLIKYNIKCCHRLCGLYWNKVVLMDN